MVSIFLYVCETLRPRLIDFAREIDDLIIPIGELVFARSSVFDGSEKLISLSEDMAIILENFGVFWRRTTEYLIEKTSSKARTQIQDIQTHTVDIHSLM